MRTLAASSSRHLLRHPLQLALAVGGLALGVATVVAVDIATESARRAFAVSLDAVQGTATHEIRAGPAGIDEAVYADLRRADLGLDLAPLVEGYVMLGGRTLLLVGVDVFADAEFRSDGGLARAARAREPGAGADGTRAAMARLADWLLAPGAFALGAQTARELGLAVGDATSVDVAGRMHAAHVASLIGPGQAGSDALLVADIAQAQEWLGLVGRLSRIQVRAPGDPAGRAALDALRGRLPPGVALAGTRRGAAQSLDMTSAFTTNLEAMSLLALLVAVFLIYSAMSFAVVQRRRTLGILRALGATRGQVLGLILAEAAVLGLSGAALGVGVGAVIGRKLVELVTRTINDLYFVVAVTDTVLPPLSLAKALGAGVGVALLAAAVPALEVARTPPQLGLRRSVLESRAARLARWLLPASLALAASAGVLVTLSRRSLLVGLAALFLLLFAVALLAPAALRWAARLASRLLWRASPAARLALSDVAASLSRTGVAIAALGMAVAAVIGIAIMVESFRESLREWLAQTMRADVYVSAPGSGFGRPERQLDPELVRALLALDGIAQHSAARRVDVESPQGPVLVHAFEVAGDARAGFELSAGDPARAWDALASGATLVSESLAWRLELEPGSSLHLRTASGDADFEVAGVYREYGYERGSAMLDRAIYIERFRDPAISSLSLQLAPGVRAGDLIARIHAAAAGRQALLVRSGVDLREISMRIFDRTFTITRVLYWLAAGVAAIGLTSALLAWELERARELAILRALGLTPLGTAWMIELQTAFMGLAAWLAALPAGLLAALMLVEVINRRAFGWQIDLHVQPGRIADALGLALAAALAAGLYPAWRAARVPLAQAVREE